ncbi:hypothetical protein [Candidatus Rickettsia kedanie]|uniref:Uncharacterized protein n=1 Tax=Candidatus Rickettsia kedanie TaxID=3115352 RepID=A0ABP9TU76_9RICK
MYNYTAYVKHLNYKVKKQENTEIVDNIISEKHLFRILNDNNNETQPTQTLLNQNSFEIIDNIEYNKAENMRNTMTMMLKKEEVKEAEEAEMDNFISDMLKDKNFIDLINKDSEKYESIIDRSNKAIIILGQEKED